MWQGSQPTDLQGTVGVGGMSQRGMWCWLFGSFTLEGEAVPPRPASFLIAFPGTEPENCGKKQIEHPYNFESPRMLAREVKRILIRRYQWTSKIAWGVLMKRECEKSSYFYFCLHSRK